MNDTQRLAIALTEHAACCQECEDAEAQGIGQLCPEFERILVAIKEAAQRDSSSR